MTSIKITVPELKRLCFEKGLSPSGNKPDLVERILNYENSKSNRKKHPKKISAKGSSKSKTKTPKKYKSLPKAVRNSVWVQYLGNENGIGKCLCCGSQIDRGHYECGHVISRNQGGNDTIQNLRPICGSCNKSMSTQNMEEFMKQHGYDQPSNWIGYKKEDDQKFVVNILSDNISKNTSFELNTLSSFDQDQLNQPLLEDSESDNDEDSTDTDDELMENIPKANNTQQFNENCCIII